MNGNSSTSGFEPLRAPLQMVLGATVMVPQDQMPFWLNQFRVVLALLGFFGRGRF